MLRMDFQHTYGLLGNVFSLFCRVRFAAGMSVFQRKSVLSRERGEGGFQPHIALSLMCGLIAPRACNLSEVLAVIVYDCRLSILSRRDMILLTPYKAAGRNMGWKSGVYACRGALKNCIEAMDFLTAEGTHCNR